MFRILWEGISRALLHILAQNLFGLFMMRSLFSSNYWLLQLFFNVATHGDINLAGAMLILKCPMIFIDPVFHEMWLTTWPLIWQHIVRVAISFPIGVYFHPSNRQWLHIIKIPSSFNHEPNIYHFNSSIIQSTTHYLSSYSNPIVLYHDISWYPHYHWNQEPSVYHYNAMIIQPWAHYHPLSINIYI